MLESGVHLTGDCDIANPHFEPAVLMVAADLESVLGVETASARGERVVFLPMISRWQRVALPSNLAAARLGRIASTQ